MVSTGVGGIPTVDFAGGEAQLVVPPWDLEFAGQRQFCRRRWTPYVSFPANSAFAGEDAEFSIFPYISPSISSTVAPLSGVYRWHSEGPTLNLDSNSEPKR